MSKATNTLSAGRPSTKAKAATLASLADGEMRRVNFELPIDQHTKLKVYAARHGVTIKVLLARYVAQLPE